MFQVFQRCCARVGCLLALGWALTAPVCAQNLDPRVEEVRFEVKDIALEGFSTLENSAVGFLPVKNHLAEERAKFGLLMTVAQLNQLADAMTLYVRAQGYPFHAVYLPPQTVTQGQVRFTLQEGVLADVQVINNTRWPDTRFTQPFAQLLGKLLYAPAVEHQVFALKAQAGFKVFAFYSRGQQPGEARLNLRVEPAAKRITSLRLDNYGSAASGRYRATGQWQEHNLTGHFDELSLAVLQTLDDVSNTYGSITYQRAFAALDWVWDLSLSNNQFEVGAQFAPLQLAGTSDSLSTGLSYYFDWQDGQRRWLQLEAFQKSSSLDSGFMHSLGQEETSRGLTLGWNQEISFGRIGLGLGLDGTLGHYTRKPQLNTGQVFSKLAWSLALGRAAGEGRFGLRPSFGLRGQWSDKALPSIEDVSLTGAYGVRALKTGEFSADAAWQTSLEVAAPQLLPKGQQWQFEPFVFVDAAQGERFQTPGAPRSEGQFSGMGLGLRASVSRHVDAKLQISMPLDGDIDGVAVPTSGEVLFEFRIH